MGGYISQKAGQRKKKKNKHKNNNKKIRQVLKILDTDKDLLDNIQIAFSSW